jgi:hypothetical protein
MLGSLDGYGAWVLVHSSLFLEVEITCKCYAKTHEIVLSLLSYKRNIKYLITFTEFLRYINRVVFTGQLNVINSFYQTLLGS